MGKGMLRANPFVFHSPLIRAAIRRISGRGEADHALPFEILVGRIRLGPPTLILSMR